MNVSIKIPMRKQVTIFDYIGKSKLIKERFLQSDLGKIYLAIPWQKIIYALGLKVSNKGSDCTFSSQGKLALMFLKSYLNCSDKKLMEQINGNMNLKIFCGLDILQISEVANYKIISKIRVELSSLLKIDEVQKVLFNHWKPYMENLGHITMDATCYETSMRYPTDQKLLWESIEFIQKHVISFEKELGIKLARNQYKKWNKEQKNYKRKKLPRKSLRKRITRGFLNLLDRLKTDLSYLESEYKQKHPEKSFKSIYMNKRKSIEKIYEQQKALFNENVKPKDRIVSISKPYIRPIVRGKERKKVEFGAKLNKFQIDRISFIEKISFDNFNEGCNYISSIEKSEDLTGEKVKIVGADAIYSKNSNRIYVKEKGIKTDFVRKGKAGKDEVPRKKLSLMISKERGSSLEGSFGKDKENYGLREVKAKKKETEILWIFFGIHTGNALEIGRRLHIKYEEYRKLLKRTG